MPSRVPRLMEAIRMQGFWEVIEERDNDADRGQEEWDSSVVYAVGDEVSVTGSGDGSKVFYRAAGLGAASSVDGKDDGAIASGCSVFTAPHTVNASVVRLLARDAPKNLGLARLVIFGVQAFWAMLLVLCCITSPFWPYYAGMAFGSMAVFYVGAEEKLPLDKLLSIVSSDSTEAVSH